MEILAEISDYDLGIGGPARYDKPYTFRRAARAVLFNKEEKIAFLHMTRLGYHKLPGGGFWGDEDVAGALRRELLEETGCTMDVLAEIGMVIEYRNQTDTLQISYAYLGKVVGKVGEPHFEHDEVEDGAIHQWVSIEDASRTLAMEAPDNYEGKFIVRRDSMILKAAQKIMSTRKLIFSNS
ncbi:MAG: NUDIX domain-containing protein [Parcubacteria group bacterium]|nr:NUDIX domain-containing protein [Parcubacteria group bacterium]